MHDLVRRVGRHVFGRDLFKRQPAGRRRDDDGNAANKAGSIPDTTPKQSEPEIDENQQTELFADMTLDLGKCETLLDLDEWAELYRPQKPLLKKSQQVEVTAKFNELKADIIARKK